MTTDILQIDCDSTPIKLPFVSRVVSYYLEQKNDLDKEKGTIFYLAPTNKHVADLTRDGADFYMQSLYSKLYDFENTTIELMDNAINEREIFPLIENNDASESLYVIFNAHLVYHFESNNDDLVMFGSGSLCNDTLAFINTKKKKNKIILLNDKYFYGHRAPSIADKNVLEEKNLSVLTFAMESNPLTANQKTIASIEKNLNLGIYNQLKWDTNPNMKTLKDDEFKSSLKNRIITNNLHKTHILTREKIDSDATNKWVRKIVKNSDRINKGDVVWIKNKVILPEATDPFSVPKFALSGDIGEVIEIVKRYSFKSTQYKYQPIEISLCKIKLHDYSSVKDIYLYDYSNTELQELENKYTSRLGIKKHIQIRMRELVDAYLSTNNINVKDVLLAKDFEQYDKELKELKHKYLFEDKASSEKDRNKLNAKWKINKRKETYARIELHKDISSEYFILNQFAFYEFGWSLPVKNSYGYQFNDTFLAEYISPEQNAERVHQYLYSALSCSQNLYLKNLSEFSPLIGLNTHNIKIPSESSMKNNTVIFKYNGDLETEFTKQLKEKYQLENCSISLVKFCEFILTKIKSNQQITLQKIDHLRYQERYFFGFDSHSIVIDFSYNNQNEFKIKANQSIPDELNAILKNNPHELVSLNFIDDGTWQSKIFIAFQKTLLEHGAFIFEFEHKKWLFDFKIVFNNQITRLQFDYNKNGYITRLDIVNTTDEESTLKVVEILKIVIEK